jgi:hypothetical protein
MHGKSVNKEKTTGMVDAVVSVPAIRNSFILSLALTRILL